MSTYTNYLLESTIVFALLYLIYLIFLCNENLFGLRRAFLHLIIFTALILPLFHFSGPFPSFKPLGTYIILPDMVLQNSIPEDNPHKKLPPSGTSMLGIIYWSVAGIMLTLFLYKLLRLIRYINRFSKVKLGRAFVIETTDRTPIFSFFNYIGIGNASYFSHDDKQKIIYHELVHIHQYHSLDILISESLKVFFWFNPVVYLIHAEFHNVHEYEADQSTIEKTDYSSYSSLLMRMALVSSEFPLASHFNKSLTVKRLEMMKTLKKKISTWKVALIIPLFILVAMVISCQQDVMDQVNVAVEDSQLTSNIPPNVLSKLRNKENENPGNKYIAIEWNDEGRAKLNELQTEFGATTDFEVMQDESDKVNKLYAFITWSGKNGKSEDEIYSITEEPATPRDGINEFYKRIGNTLHYPEEAKQKEIEGRVFVEFITGLDGEMTSFRVLRGVDPLIDIEALKVLKELNEKWIPAYQNGKPVRQRMVMPISFKL